MAVETVTKIAYQLKMNNGLSPTGQQKTININLGKLSLSGYNLSGAAAIASALTRILERPIVAEYEATTATVSRS